MAAHEKPQDRRRPTASNPKVALWLRARHGLAVVFRLRGDPWGSAAALAAVTVLVAMVAVVVAPWFTETSTYGFHDWDAITSFRYLTVDSLVKHGEFPGWNPYACGGYPLWGYVEGATNVVSPWLPVYLVAPIQLAIRIETAGMGLVGAFGAYALAGRFTRSSSARLLCAALWAVNGRWGLQAASGHAWHLAYGYLPWALHFFERARSSLAVRDLGLTGGFLALMVYAGGIYPLPHAVLVLGLYAVLTAAQDRRLKPLYALALSGAVALGLAAPKLLPVLRAFADDPRLIASDERLDVGAFVTLLTSRDQRFDSRPARVTPYGWHEWGMYISTAGVLALVAAFVLVEGKRERILKVIGALLVVLGFGAFHVQAPWPWVHRNLPVFRSQHVPSRFLYPAVLVLGLVLASGVGRFVDRRRRRSPWLDALLVVPVALLAFDVAGVAQLPMRQSMWMQAPRIEPRREFHFEREPPFQYRKRDWAGPMLLAMYGNTGVMNCYGVPPPRQLGARARDAPDYRGEAYLVEREGGGARVTGRTPNSAVIDIEGAEAGDRLVFNMNHREGWSSDVGRLEPYEGAISVVLPAGARRVVLRYRPPGLLAGLALGLTTLAALGWAQRRMRQT